MNVVIVLPLRRAANSIQVLVGIDSVLESTSIGASVPSVRARRRTLVDNLVRVQPVALELSMYFSAKTCSPEVLLNLTQSSTVKLPVPTLRGALSGTLTKAPWPLRTNA